MTINRATVANLQVDNPLYPYAALWHYYESQSRETREAREFSIALAPVSRLSATLATATCRPAKLCAMHLTG